MFRSKFSKTAFQLIELNSFPRFSKKKFLIIPFSILTLICFFNNFNYFTKRDYKEKSESNKERYQPLGPYVYPSA